VRTIRRCSGYPIVFGFWLATSTVGLSGQSGAQNQQSQPSGRDLFKTYCASCHGTSARGDGPLAEHLKKRPPDLTLFAKRNGDAFPSALVYRIIDGRQPMPGHGGPDMPVWGDAFARSRLGSSEESVKRRIDAIVEYLESLQQKSGE
jgi:mono/diheme cytochrome c family protein